MFLDDVDQALMLSLRGNLLAIRGRQGWMCGLGIVGKNRGLKLFKGF